MATSTNRKRTTLADLMAAAALGAIDPAAEVVTAEDADAETLIATAEATATAVQAGALRAATAERTGTEHECAIPGCRHGAAHGGPVQPDRQLKLAAPCGAVARMTASALTKSGGTLTCGHGDPFAIAERRTYSRKSA